MKTYRSLVLGLVALLAVGIGGWGIYQYTMRPGGESGADPKVEPFVVDAPADPRLDPSLIWRNARPDVAYVGDKACQVCHEGICDLYHKSHTMARSSSLAGKPDAAGQTGIEGFGPTHHTSFEKDQIRFSVTKTPEGQFKQKEEYFDESGSTVVERNFDYTIAVGSGHRGRSYIFEKDGWLFQTTMSWFSKAGIWDISPGFQLERENLGRPIKRLCIICHTNQAALVAGTVNKYEPFSVQNLGIGCERCHGPGKLHCDERANDPAPVIERTRTKVAAFSSGGFQGIPGPADTSIVNPARLAPALRDSVCNQCHLQGEKRVERSGRKMEEFRPGLPLSDFMAIFVLQPSISDKNKAVGQVEQMTSSVCYIKSGEKLGCISCHDPHSLPTEEVRIEFYRNKCLNCHKGDTPPATGQFPSVKNGANLAQAGPQEAAGKKQEKPTALRPEVGSQASPTPPRKTDPTGGISPPCSLPPEHRLARRNDCAACHLPRRASSDIAHTSLSDHRILRNPANVPAGGRGLQQGELPLVPFPARSVTAPDRDLTIALTQLTFDQPAAKAVLLPMVGPGLDELIRRNPGDFELWATQAERLSLEGRHEESLKIWERLRTARPEDETTLLGCSLAALRVGQKARAAELSKRLLRICPDNSGYILLAGDILKSLGQFREALPLLEEGVRNQPASLRLRRSLVECLVRLGRNDEARAQLELLAKLSRQGEGDLRRWFARLLAEAR